MRIINGSLVKLKPLSIKDSDLFSTWVRDREVTKYSLSKWLKKYSKNQIKEWLQSIINNKKSVNFGIVEKYSNNLIGYAGIANLNKKYKSGEYFIFIGNKSAWGKGYGTEVTKLIVEHGFKRLKLHRIQLTVSEPNIAGIKAYLKAGFKQEGIMRDAVMRDGKYHNKIIMSMLEDEWKKLS